MSDHEQPPQGEGPPAKLLPNTPFDDAAYEPLPSDAESAAQVLARLEEANRRQSAPTGPVQFNEDKQLTIRQLMLVILFVSVCMGQLRSLDPATGAGMMGSVLLVGMLVAKLLNQPLPLIVQLAGWGLSLVYLMMCIAAYAHMNTR